MLLYHYPDTATVEGGLTVELLIGDVGQSQGIISLTFTASGAHLGSRQNVLVCGLI